MPVLKVKNNGVWENVFNISDHTHEVDDITNFPSSMPANGGDADTLDGKHASEFAAASDVSTLSELVGDIPVSEQITDAVKDLSNKKSLTINSVVVSSTNTIDLNNYVTPGEWVVESDDSLISIWNGVLNAPYNSETSDTIPVHRTFKLTCEKWNISHQNTTHTTEGYINLIQKIIDQDGSVYYRFVELLLNPEDESTYLYSFENWDAHPVLPNVTLNDNGKILQVINGVWSSSELTEEQKEMLKGDKGDKGDPGISGASCSITAQESENGYNLLIENTAAGGGSSQTTLVPILNGQDGAKGDKGDPGSDADVSEFMDNLSLIDGGNAFTNTYGSSEINTSIKWACLGDSITDVRNNRPNNYPYWIKVNNPSMTVQNLGIAGALISFDRDNKLSDGSAVNSLYTQAKSIAADTDIITIFGGVNDYNWSVPLGTFTTSLSGYPTSKVITANGGGTVADGGGIPNGGTFYQGCFRLAQYLRTTFPNKPIVWFTPMTFGVGNTEGKDVKNKYNNTIYQFMDAIKEVAGYFSIPCYDLGRLCSITPRIQAMQDAYYFDNLHPNANGSLIISRIIEREMKKVLMEWGVNL